MIFWFGNLEKRNHMEDQGVVGKIILQLDLREMEWEGEDGMYLAQDRVQWQVLLNTVMNLQVPS
jgi:hypothetical protein